jgi:hypothetical protein
MDVKGLPKDRESFGKPVALSCFTHGCDSDMNGHCPGNVVADKATFASLAITFGQSLLPCLVEMNCVHVIAVAGFDFVPAKAANANEGLLLTRSLDGFFHLLFRLQFNHFFSPV